MKKRKKLEIINLNVKSFIFSALVFLPVEISLTETLLERKKEIFTSIFTIAMLIIT